MPALTPKFWLYWSLTTVAALLFAAWLTVSWARPELAVLVLGQIAALVILERKKDNEKLVYWMRLFIICSIAFIVNCICNLPLMGGEESLFKPFCISVALICFSWALLRAYSLIIIAPLIAIQLTQVHIFLHYGSYINSLVLAESMEGSLTEANTYLTSSNVTFFIIACAVAAYLSSLLLRALRKETRIKLLLIGLGSIICGYTLSPHGDDIKAGHLWPLDECQRLSQSVIEAFNNNYETIELTQSLPSPALKESSLSTLKGDEGLVVILHIGESLRADHMSINGYARPTTPRIESMDGLINFHDWVSPAFDTSLACICLLTDARRRMHQGGEEMQPSTGSVIDLYRKHDFKLYNFYGKAVGQQLKFDRVIRMLGSGASASFNTPARPLSSLPQIDSVLAEKGSQNMIWLINNEGSHAPFANYDPESEVFSPSKPSFDQPELNSEAIINAYDNTIEYTDRFVSEICSRLKGRPYIYIYVSDHGEYVGQHGMWGRAAIGDNHAMYQRSAASRVGAFIRSSPEFEALHPHFATAVEQLRRNSKLCVGHEHLFHSLLGIIGLKSPYYKATLDLSSPEVQPYTGSMPQPSSDDK